MNCDQRFFTYATLPLSPAFFKLVVSEAYLWMIVVANRRT